MPNTSGVCVACGSPGSPTVLPRHVSLPLLLGPVRSLSHPPSASQVQAQVIQETIVPKEPPPEFEFIADPPSISAFDLDVVKLTAQFVARNGRQFLTQLMQKEQRNYQFDFLRPQHSLFNYFTKLVEQYTKVPGQDWVLGPGREPVTPPEILTVSREQTLGTSA